MESIVKNAFVTSALVCMAALGAALLSVSPVAAQSTTFTFQGFLNEGAAPANGRYDFHFRLFTAATGGVQTGTMLCSDDVDVVNGVFTTQLDFGQQYATPIERHLEIEVRRDSGASCADLNGFIVMDPRQLLTATPKAIHANSAFALDGADGSPLNAVYVDDAGKVGIGTTSPATLLHVQGAAPSLVLQDVTAAASQSGYLSFRNNLSTETAWVGFGTAGSPHFSIVNARSGGNISLEAVTITSTGSVGIGTAAPASTLDVRGDIRLGSAGQYQAASGEEKLRILRGRISSSGTVSLGSGFTVSRTGTGLYVITFTTAFSGPPAVTLSPSVGATGGPYNAHTNGISTVAAGIRIMNGSGTNIDDAFDFIAIGPR